MNTIKKPAFICTLALLLLTVTNIEGATTVDINNNAIGYFPENHLVVSPISSMEYGANKHELIKRDCTVRFTTNNMDVEVTFYDVSWWTCTKLKVGAWWHRNF